MYMYQHCGKNSILTEFVFGSYHRGKRLKNDNHLVYYLKTIFAGSSGLQMANSPEVFVIREFEVEMKSKPRYVHRPTGCYKIMCNRFQRGKPQPQKELIEELQKGNPRFIGSHPDISYCASDPYRALQEVKLGETKNQVKDSEGWFCSSEPWNVIQARIESILKKYPCK